ncbi:hypothetical protein LCGC14_2571610 [marine sediment metagenome]|uniref:Uncharacterized protein n=1 Tax=marine sediment metagenome TaxID=412755 RepID=A0A0F9B500_9ZZZZ
MVHMKLKADLEQRRQLEIRCWAEDVGIAISGNGCLPNGDISLYRKDVPKLIALLTAYLEVG